MAKCKQCNKDYNAKRSTSAYCSPKCKQAFYRNNIKPSVTLKAGSVTVEPITVTKGKCWCCGDAIEPMLVCCGPCAWSGKAAAKRAGTPPKEAKATPYKMTVMERLFYTPAHLLKQGETNFVSLPGRACYGVYPTGAII